MCCSGGLFDVDRGGLFRRSQEFSKKKKIFAGLEAAAKTLKINKK
jgi:hypothetical protein